MNHNWEKYVDTESELFEQLMVIYEKNDAFPKKIVKGRNLHHKFLRSWSKAENEEIDNDDDNLVSLGLGDHFLAHWILWKISKTGWKRYTARAVLLMYKKGLKYVTLDAAKIIAEEWNDVEKDIVPWNKGKELSEEYRRKLSEADRGKELSEEHKRKISEAQKGKKHGPRSEEVRLKISDARKRYWAEKRNHN